MEEKLISKKELLDLTGISYGQLYRWKRKKLIPEEWFIKKSAFTGQETFFPKDKILDRINKILEKKDDISLDELAEIISGVEYDYNLTIEELLERNIVTFSSLELYKQRYDIEQVLEYKNVFLIYIFNTLLENGNLALEEIFSVIDGLNNNYETQKINEYKLIFIRKLGVGIALLTNGDNFLLGEGKVIENIDLNGFNERLKSKLM